MGARPRRGRRAGHRHLARQRLALPAAEGADAHAGRAGAAARAAAPAAGARAAPAARDLRGAVGDRARARALCRGGAAGDGADGIRAPAQLAVVGPVARSAHAARRALRPGRHAGRQRTALAAATAGDRARAQRRGAAHERDGEQPARHGTAAKRRGAAEARVAADRGGRRHRIAVGRHGAGRSTPCAPSSPPICRWSTSTRC